MRSWGEEEDEEERGGDYEVDPGIKALVFACMAAGILWTLVLGNWELHPKDLLRKQQYFKLATHLLFTIFLFFCAVFLISFTLISCIHFVTKYYSHHFNQQTTLPEVAQALLIKQKEEDAEGSSATFV